MSDLIQFNNDTLNNLVFMMLPVNAADLFQQLDRKQSYFADWAVSHALGHVDLEKVRKEAMRAWTWWNHAKY
jgi:hypothetical protein